MSREEIEARLQAADARADVLAAEHRADIARIDAKFDVILGELRLIHQRIDGLEQRMDRIEQRMDRLEQRMDRLDQRMDQVEHDRRDDRKHLDQQVEHITAEMRKTRWAVGTMVITGVIGAVALQLAIISATVDSVDYGRRTGQFETRLERLERLIPGLRPQ